MANALLVPGNNGFVDIKKFCSNIFDNPDIFSTSKVLELTHYKETDSVQHEFLVAQIQLNEDIYKLKMERGIDRSAPLIHKSTSEAAALDRISMWKGDSSSSQSLRQSIWFWRRKPIQGLLSIRTLKPKREPFLLEELCFVLYFVTQASPRYNLKRYQCYWFCWIILEVLKLELSEEVYIRPGQDFVKGGTFNNLVILNRSETILMDFINENRKKLDGIHGLEAQLPIQRYFKNAFQQPTNLKTPVENPAKSIFQQYALQQMASKKTVVDAIDRIVHEQRAEEAMTPAARALHRAARSSSHDHRFSDERKNDSWAIFDDFNGAAPSKKRLAASFDSW